MQDILQLQVSRLPYINQWQCQNASKFELPRRLGFRNKYKNLKSAKIWEHNDIMKVENMYLREENHFPLYPPVGLLVSHNLVFPIRIFCIATSDQLSRWLLHHCPCHPTSDSSLLPSLSRCYLVSLSLYKSTCLFNIARST